jgi:hypothetical protein
MATLRESRAAAVDEHRANADLVQDADLLDKRAGQRRVGEHFAAGLDDEHLAFEKPDVRRRVLERRNDNRAISLRRHCGPPSIW